MRSEVGQEANLLVREGRKEGGRVLDPLPLNSSSDMT